MCGPHSTGCRHRELRSVLWVPFLQQNTGSEVGRLTAYGQGWRGHFWGPEDGGHRWPLRGGGMGRGWRSLGPAPLLPGSPPRLSVSCRPGEWEKAERPRAGDGANSLVTPQQELGARSASVIHQRDCPLPACVGRNASTFYLYPPRRTRWEAEVLSESKKKPGERRGLVPAPRDPGRCARRAGAGEAGHVAPAGAGSASSKHVVRGAAGLPPPQRMFPQGASV